MGILDKIFVILRLVFCIVNNFYAIPVYATLYIVLLPLRIISPIKFWGVEGRLYEKLIAMVGFWAQIAGHKVYISGDDVTSILNDESILMSNHQTTGDIPVLMYTFRGLRPSLRHMMWIMDWILQCLNFGWIARCHGDCFLLQGSDIRRYSFLFKGTEEEIKIAESKRFKRHIKDIFCTRDRKWMILFPEGGFLSKRKAGSQRFSQRNNLPVLNHVSMPRTGAFQAITDVLGVQRLNSNYGEEPRKNVPNGHGPKNSTSNNKQLKWIIDATIGYRDQEPVGFGSWVMGHEGPKNIFIHFRVFHASDLLAHDGEGDGSGGKISEKWVYDRFIEKEKLLKDFYATGIFPGGKLGVKRVKCHTFQTLVDHLFCLAPYFFLAYLYFA